MVVHGGRLTWCGVFALAIGAAVGLLVSASARAVVGGKPLDIRSAPWSAMVRVDFPHDPATCSGAIIDQRHVLTAAHCLYSDSGAFARNGAVSVIAGVSATAGLPSADAPEQRRVASVRIPRGYVWWAGLAPAETAATDVAVLTLSRPLLTSASIQPIAIWMGQRPFADRGAPVSVTAFGSSGSSGSSGVLRDAVMHLSAARRCTKGAICVQSPSVSTCGGDSGGAVVADSPSPVLVGLVVLGSPACERGSTSTLFALDATVAADFIRARSPVGPPPEPPATRWTPRGWRSFGGMGIGSLAYSLPRTWGTFPVTRAARHETIAMSTTTTAEVDIGYQPHPRSYAAYTAKNFSETRTQALRSDPDAQIETRTINLPGIGRTFETDVTYRSQRGRITDLTYAFVHNGTGYSVQYAGLAADDGIDVPVFRRSALTLHFA